MAFLAKQFMSLLLLLIISRLILSTDAVREHFSQFGRMTTTATTDTTDPTDQKPNNYGKFSPPAFYPNIGERNGLGNSPPSTPTSFLPSNYDPKMYTTSQETQKNMYANVQKNDDQAVEETYRAYNPFSNSKYDEQYNANYKKPTTTESKKQREEPNEFYSKDTSSNVYNNQQTQSSKPFSSSSKFNQQYNQPQEKEPVRAKNYDPFTSNEFSQQYNENKDQNYPTTVPVNQFYQQNNQFQRQYDPTEATKYDPYRTSKTDKQFIEAKEEKEEKPTTVPESYKYNPFQRAYDPTESKKQSNSKSNEQYTTVAEKYANEDAEFDAFLEEQEDKHGKPTTPSYKFSKNSVPAESHGNTMKDTNNEWDTWQAYGQKQEKDNKNNEWDTWQAYGQKQEKDNKYTDSETYKNTKKDTNYDWPAYNQKHQGKDNKPFAMTDAELNAILDEEEKQDEDVIESPPQGMSDTRWPTNKPHSDQQAYNWKDHADVYANAFSGNAFAIAAQNNP